MYFLPRDEAKRLEKTLRRQIAEQPKPKLVLYYKSGDRDYASAAQAIAASMGAFSEVTLLYLFCVTGDGWSEYAKSNALWTAYRKWRKAAGEMRRLYEAPGHQFETGEVEPLARVIEHALWLGWDALIAGKPGRQLAFLSHDDRLEVYRGFDRRVLARKLTALGYWRQGERIEAAASLRRFNHQRH
jgi:hypothetical protein